MFTKYEQIIEFFNERKKYGIKPGLDRVRQLLKMLNHPEKKMKAVHIAGTNGKGSTISYLQHALMNNGYKVGVYTSPSLDGLTGHIFCNEANISDETFLCIFNEMYPSITELDLSGDHPTEYEILTVLAFMYFANHVDIALIETAMGGREDTTNCFQPILSIITNVDKDHTAFLGETIKEIADHKAGIIKESTPVIVGDVSGEAFSVIQNEAARKQAKIYRLGEAFSYHNAMQINDRQTYTWANQSGQSMNITLHMYGEHQVKNSSLAIKGIQYLMENGYRINMETALAAIESTVVPGRFEVIHENPKIIIDGAHNLAGIQSFLVAVNNNFQHDDKHVVFSGFKDKDLQKMLQLLTTEFKSITLTSFANPRAARAKELYDLIDLEHKYMSEDWRKVMQEIITNNKHHKTVYFITGSLHFIALIRKYVCEL